MDLPGSLGTVASDPSPVTVSGQKLKAAVLYAVGQSTVAFHLQ